MPDSKKPKKEVPLEEKCPEPTRPAPVPPMPKDPPRLVRQKARCVDPESKLLIFTDTRLPKKAVELISKYGGCSQYTHEMDGVELQKVVDKYDILLLPLACSHCRSFCGLNSTAIKSMHRIAVTSRKNQAWLEALEITDIVTPKKLTKLKAPTEFAEVEPLTLVRDLNPATTLTIPAPESILRTLLKAIFRKIVKGSS